MSTETLVYVGTYTMKGAEGIYVYRLDPSCGALSLVTKVTDVENPSFLAIDPQQRYLYAVNEFTDPTGKKEGTVSAFAIDPRTGDLTFLNRQPSHGRAPCHVSIDQTGRFVFIANYLSGTVAVLPTRDDGSLAPATDVIEHHGAGINPKRQKGPHAHSVNLDPTNRYAFVADLGIDKIVAYRLDLDRGRLVPHDVPWIEVQAGSGPRHMAFHPDGRYAYLINEMGSTIAVCAYDRTCGTLEQVQTLSTLPDEYEGPNDCADIHVAPSGRFVYGSNRGHDSIVIMEWDEKLGRLERVGHTSTQGKTPRNFALDPTGTYLLAANQDTDTIVTLNIDQQTGQLTPAGHVTEVPAPVCLKPVVFTGLSDPG